MSNIYNAILRVYQKVGYILKTGHNSSQNYRYASESDLIEALRPAMIEEGLICFPYVIRGECNRITSKDKNVEVTKNHATYIYTFRIVHAESGTHIDIEAAGEGIGNDDKSSYKAATGAQKYALRQLFLIETGDDPDKDTISIRERQEAERLAKEEAEKEAQIQRFAENCFVEIPTLLENGERDWPNYTLALITLIKGAAFKEEIKTLYARNKEGLEFLSAADEKLRAQIAEISKRHVEHLETK